MALIYNLSRNMHAARIADLLQPFLSPTPNPCHSEPGQGPGEEPAVLSQSQLHSISTYIDLLLRWNARINLTAIRNPEEIVARHFGESLFAASHLFQPYPVSPEPPVVKGVDVNVNVDKAEARVADLGSGAGFPGLPIKLWAPGIGLTLIESNHKKATFLREIVRALELTNVTVQNARAETLSKSSFDVVTLRAVERFANVLPIAARLLAPSGRLALLVGEPQVAEASAILSHFTIFPPIPIPESKSRFLLIATSEPR